MKKLVLKLCGIATFLIVFQLLFIQTFAAQGRAIEKSVFVYPSEPEYVVKKYIEGYIFNIQKEMDQYISSPDRKEYYEKNKEYFRAKAKIWAENNRNYLNEYHRQYNRNKRNKMLTEEEKEKRAIYQKKYYEIHKEKIAARKREYYIKKKEKEKISSK
jgi:hypothetical protein